MIRKPIISFFLTFFAVSAFAYNQTSEKPPFTPEQIHEDSLKSEVLKSKFPVPVSNHAKNDSLRELLKISDTIRYSCLDANCYIKSSEYNQFLNVWAISSMKNPDSVQTSILFNFLRKKYIELQSEQFESQSPTFEDECDSSNVFYKILMLTSTDSSLLAKTMQNNTKQNLLLTKPVKVGFIKHDTKDSEIVNFFFNFEKDFLDFPIDKERLDSAILNQWNTPVKSPFGFFTFLVIDKRLCLSGYSDISKKIEYERFKKEEQSFKSSDFNINNNDTILVQYWSQPVVLSQKKNLLKIDTTLLKGIQTTDLYLPYSVRTTIREQYYKKGITYFDNFKNEYCVWSLKILNVAKGNINKETEANYLISKRIHKILFTENRKKNEKAESSIRNTYLSHLYRQNCLQNGLEWNEKQIPIKIVEMTETQLDKATYEWIKKNVHFINPIFFDKYLPQQIKN